MKKFIVTLLIVVTGVILSVSKISAQSCTNVDSTVIDSTVVTNNSVTFWLHIYNLQVSAFRTIYYGLGTNYQSSNTMPVMTSATLDNVFIITVSGLLPNTMYSFQGKLLGGASCASDTIMVRTASCPFTPSISGLDHVCSGTSATLTASPLGGTSYVWKRNGGTQVGTGVSYNASITGVYTCEVTFSGCTSVTPAFNFQVNGNPAVSITPASQSVCLGSSATLTANGGVSYVWSTGLTTNPLVTNPASNSTYTVNATDANGCTGTASANITVNSLPNISVIASPSTICAGASATINATGGTSYNWNTGQSGNSISVSPLVTTTYTVTGTSNGCTNSATVTVNVNSKPNVTASALPNTVCAGTSTILSASGATTYQWNPGGHTGSTVGVMPFTTTTYTVTGTASGCSNTTTVEVVVIPMPVVTVSASSTNICAGSSITLMSSGGSSYLWTPGNLTGPIVTVNPSSTTTYNVIADEQGCIGSNSITINVTNPPTVSLSVSSTPICVGSSTNLTASGATSYSWSNGLGTGSTKTVSPTSTTTYTVTGTTNGCTGSTIATVTVNQNPTVAITPSANPICSGSSSILTASGADTYSWSDGLGIGNSKTVSPVSATNYFVTGTDVNGCVDTASITINVFGSITMSVNNSVSICFGDSVQLVASGDATSYTWSPIVGLSNPNIANPKASPTTTTTYTVIGNNISCSKTMMVTVVVNPLPTVDAGNNQTVCAGTSVTLNGSGATTYAWSNGVTNGISFIPSVTSTYTVTGTDLSGCKNTDQVTVTVNPLPTPTASATSPVCFGFTTTLSATGGIHYHWNTGDTTATFATTLPVGTTNFTVTVTDVNGCVATASTSAIVNPLPTVSIISNNNAVCFGSQTTLIAFGADSYLWDQGLGVNDTVVITPASTTSYSVVGSALGCSSTTSITITVKPNPIVSASAAQNTICEGASTLLTASGATSYSWSTGQTGDTISVTPTVNTDYFVIGLNDGCTGIDTVLVTVKPNPIVSASAAQNTICEGASTLLTASGATFYSWSTSQTGNSISVSPTTSTVYFVIGEENGCFGNASVGIAVNSLPTITASAFPSTICEGGSAQLSANGGITYSWSTLNLNGQTVTANPSSTTTYVVTGLNANGCTNTATVTVQVDPSVHLTTGGDQTICEGSSGVYISASGANSYHWSPTNLVSNANISNTFAFPDTTTIFNVVGTVGTCSDTAFVLVSVIDNPVVDSIYYESSNGMLYIEGSLQGLAFIRIGSIVYIPFSVSNTDAWFTGVNLVNGQGIYVENVSGCSTFFPYEDVSGISSETSEIEVLVYPNPFISNIAVELPNGNYNVSLTNVSGQIVREISANGNFEIHGEDLSSGIYFLNIYSDEGNYLTKLIKN